MKTIIFFFCLLITVSLSAQISKFESNAKNFEFERTKLGLTLAEFKNKYPSAIKIVDDDEAIGVLAYKVYELISASYGYFYFFENKFYLGNIIYSESKLDSFGGVETLLNRLLEKLGRENAKYNTIEDENKVAVFRWDFKNISRYFELLSYKDGSVKFLFDDELVTKKIKEKKAQAANVGF